MGDVEHTTEGPLMYAAHLRGLPGLDITDAGALLDSMQSTLSNAYVHYQQKASAFGINVIRELEILKDILPFINSEREFFERVQTITKRLYDRHTGIVATDHRGSLTAYLPLMLETCWDENRKKVIVTHLLPGADTRGLEVGTEITHWNGAQIGGYLDDASWKYEGANPYARVALACRSLTVRPLGYFALPLEDWVTLTTWDGYKTGSVTLPWQIYEQRPNMTAPVSAGMAGAALHRGIDASRQMLNFSLKTLFADEAQARQNATFILSEADAREMNPLPDNLIFNVIRVGRKSYGYIRLFTFEAQNAADFVTKLCRICAVLPQTIIIDIRANPGGTIPAGEMSLQLFKGEAVAFSGLQFRNTKFIKKLVDQSDYFTVWRPSVNIGIDTGMEFSQAFPITDRDDFPSIPFAAKNAVLIVDALAYSTSDFFAAGFKDNRIGPIIGVDPTTGAGGANVWSFNDLAQFDALTNNPSLPPLPAVYDFNLAVRRSLRVGAMAGLPLEGLGAEADVTYRLTKQDVLSKNEGLLGFAASVAEKSF